MADAKNPKKPIDYFCEKCNFKCCNKKDYTRHTTTLKHKMLTLTDAKNPKLPLMVNHHKCECGREYKHRQSLHKHKKKCNYENEINKNEINYENKINKNEINEINYENEKSEISKNDYKDMFFAIAEKNNELQSMLVEQSKQMKELIPKIGNNNTSNSHNKFNLNVFLNESCKDALNIMDFIESLKMKLEDLEFTGKHGYVNGMTQIMLNGLSKLDVTKRPVHCSDLKREIIYIKDNNIWEKDKTKEKINQAIRKVHKKNLNQFPNWVEKHPNLEDMHSDDGVHFVNIIENTMNEDTSENGKKVIKNIMKEVYIDKKND
jgi:hypothetical protein